MNLKSVIGTIYNKVWAKPKGKFSDCIREKCDTMPHKLRLRVIALMAAVFVLTAFFVFGHACYRLGQGNARKNLKIEHIGTLELPPAADMEQY